MTVFLLRHLPTSMNLEGKLQGRIDSQILYTSVSAKSIQSNLDMFKNSPVTLAYVSPLKRALQSVHVYNEILGDIEVRIDNRLTEFDFGEFENRPGEEMLAKYGAVWNHRFTKVPFGENIDDFQNRLSDFLRELKASTHERVLVVSHGVVLRYLYCKLTGKDVDTMNLHHFGNNEIKTVSGI